jgi:GAF domain-containing protein
MRRHSRASGKPAGSRGPKSSKSKGRNPPKVASSRSSRTGAATEAVALRRELREARERQTAASEVLKVISRSPGDLEPVFTAMLENAARLCDAKFGNICRWDGEALCLVATHNTPPAFVEARARSPLRPDQANPIGHLLATQNTVHVSDLSADARYTERTDPDVIMAVELGGIRTFVAVPMVKEKKLIGALILYRQQVRPFTDKQIELLQNFAAQAVIAIENARLLNELRQRTTDLTEALEQQTAASEVLGLISGSPGELDPVFRAILQNAARICEAKFGVLNLYEDDRFRTVALHNPPPQFAMRLGRVIHPHPASGLAHVARTRQIAHLDDIRTGKPYLEGEEAVVELADIGGARTVLMVPMLNKDELVGAISIYRQEVRPFTDKQIELIRNFAAQAVIAIENARLLNELRQRTTELSQRTGELETSLEYQTATSDVLKVISGSVFDLHKILEFVAETAARLCATKLVAIYLLEDEVYRFKSDFGLSPAYREIEKRQAIVPGPETLVGRVALSGETEHILDVMSDPQYGPKDDIRITGVHTILGVPLIRGGKVGGVITLAREPILPFSNEQIELVRTFADQAVIAIENTRLLNELRDRTEQVEAQSHELVRLNQQLEQRVADQVGEIERMGRLRRFLPPQVADLIVASGSEKQLESHRGEITALFCDLRGFTGFSESADPEDVSALLREYHAAIGEKIIKYSGTLERYAGDGVMVVFNDPVPVENPALQAVLMALEMRDAIGALTETWRRWGHDIGFGIGIAHGFATLGTIGFEGRFDYAAIGTVANVASRLCDEAKPGQILISPRVLTKVENAVQVEPVGEFTLKGIRRPLAACNVLAGVSQRA